MLESIDILKSGVSLNLVKQIPVLISLHTTVPQEYCVYYGPLTYKDMVKSFF